MASRVQLQESLQKKYNRLLFAKEVLSPIFNSGFTLFASAVDVSVKPNKSESKVIQQVQVYGKITLDDYTEINCYEILLQPNVLIERSRVAIQHYVRKMLTTGQAALINFVSPTYDKVWRLTFIAKDSILTEIGVKEKVTHARRYTYLLGPSETCRTAAERFESISTEKASNLELLIKAFSVERLSKIFFDEYKRHYERFIEHLSDKAYKIPFFKNDDKAIRDFTKKLLGRIVFLYFVQKKGWLGASDTNYSDGDTDFMMNLFLTTGANDTFYPNWLTKLFFDTLNSKDRKDDFELPDGKKVKIPYLNGGLFDKEEHDDHILVFNARLFHNTDNSDDPNERGFLDFLNSFNFTVFEDSPEEHTVAVDPEMLGHIFENLLEDNKDKGAFYTPKEIVHYMCQETLTEYLATQLSKEYKVYRKIGENQFELFGNETRTGQLSMIEEIGDKAIDREFVEHIVQDKDISGLSTEQLNRIDSLLDSVKICDPAIGSGAFPMGLLLEIFAIKEAIAYQLDLPWNPAEVKEKIIQDSIYGVDIEKGAVDIARLRFWLSLVVDEIMPKPLPNLDYKIVVGNSLVSKFEDEIIEIDWSLANNPALQQSRPDLFKKFNNTARIIIEKQKQYFSAEGTDKKEIAKEIRQTKLDLLQILFEVERQKIFERGIQIEYAKNKKDVVTITERKTQYQYLQKVIGNLTKLKDNPTQPFNHFDWKLDFPEILNPFVAGNNAGFDIVIGNPPYFVYENSHTNEIEDIIRNPIYSIAQSGKLNAYKVFLALCPYIQKKAYGNICLIFQNSFLGDTAAKFLREHFLKNHTILKIDSFPERDNIQKRVFESAKMSVCIFQSKNNIPNENHNFELIVWEDRLNTIKSYCKLSNAEILEFDSNTFQFPMINENEKSIFRKFYTSKNITKLNKVAPCYRGELNMTTERRFFTDEPNGYMAMKGAQIQKYYITDKLSQGKIEYVKKEEYIIENKGEKSKHHNLQRIVTQRITGVNEKNRLKATIIEKGTFCADSCNYILPVNNCYSINIILAFINSSLFNWIFKKTSTNSNVNGYEIDSLTIPENILIDVQNKFIFLVDKILSAKKTDSAANTLSWEAEIDKLVYELYCLTPEEIDIIEGRTKPV